MHLQRLQLLRYRAFVNAQIDLPPVGLVLIAGANNTDKTALLSGLDLVVRGGMVDGAQHAGSHEPAELISRLSLTTAERLELLGPGRHAHYLIQSGALEWVELRHQQSLNFGVDRITAPLADRNLPTTLVEFENDNLVAVHLKDYVEDLNLRSTARLGGVGGSTIDQFCQLFGRVHKALRDP